MSDTIVNRAADNLAESDHFDSRTTGVIAGAIDVGMGAVRQAVKQGCNASEEFMNETAHLLQRHIALTVAMTFAASVAAGAFLGWIIQ